MPTLRSNRPTVLVTIGDPAGIGPEVTLRALASRKVSAFRADFLILGDRFVIDKVKRDLKLRLAAPLSDLSNVPPKGFSYGRTSPSLGRASMEYIDRALKLLKEGEAHALVTAPVSKSSIRSSGLPNFEGHTEYLAGKTGTKDFAMMFVGKSLKVTLVTRHIALKDVPRSITTAAVYRAIALTHRYLKRYFSISRPRIGVSALNPHAGERGLFGDEEENLIMPAIMTASRRMPGVIGPVPPDAIFHEARNKKFDAVIAMYHDQALVPFKMLYFNCGVNLTLGLPFIRTSPDHGTAFDIAGKGVADPTSMIEAIALACRLAGR